MKYTQENLTNIKKINKKYIIIDVVLTCAILGLLVGLGFITKPSNQILMKVIFSICLSFLVLFIIATIFVVFLPNIHKYDFIHKMINSNTTNLKAKIVAAHGIRTMMKDKTFREIEVISKEKTYILYFDLDDGEFTYEVGEVVELELADNFIISIEKCRDFYE